MDTVAMRKFIMATLDRQLAIAEAIEELTAAGGYAIASRLTMTMQQAGISLDAAMTLLETLMKMEVIQRGPAPFTYVTGPQIGKFKELVAKVHTVCEETSTGTPS